ncbi:Flp pilus assembly protein CpaB [Aestuariibius insulae]|uniref:Flp pilus assembly protein CpaB n=1 Tax=Aestuariibius insulae TaxID=2058287 RepID=UPI00345E7AD8
MRAVFGLVLLLGLGLAGFAVYTAQGYIEQDEARSAQLEAQLASITPTVEVVAAATPLEFGDQVTQESLQIIRYPETNLPEGVFRTVEEVFNEGPGTSRYVLRPMEINEPVMLVKVTDPGVVPGISQALSPGMNAVALPVDASRGVSGFLRPESNVNVYWTGQASGRADEFTRLIESNMRVIAVDQITDPNFSGNRVASTVTVEATPQQVARLSQALNTGRISLSLVGRGDVAVDEQIEVNTREVLGIEDEVVVQEEQEEVCTVRTRQGTQVVETVVECND